MSRSLVVITRPQAESEALAETLAKRGYATLVEPLTHIEYRENVWRGEPPVVLATSRHAVWSPHRLPLETPWIVSGSATAAALAEAGYAEVTLAGQTAAALEDYLRSHPPQPRPYLYLAGKHRTRDLESVLTSTGYNITTLEAYEAVARERFSEVVRRALEEGSVDAVLFFSSRHAELFEQLSRQENLEPALAGIRAVCLSQAIAETLTPQAWKHILHSDRYSAEAVVDTLG